jgi:3-methylcrotonyl-CoA carboxylase alpha subunit
VTVAYAVTSRAGTWVSLDGNVFVVGDDRPRRPGSDDAAALAAPMPATVVSIQVEPGQQVKAGDVLILLEAMKMELSIRAPRDGRVVRIACTQGELVQPGVSLVELE